MKNIFLFVIGLYFGKHYPNYIPLPRLSKENIDKVLKKLEETEKKL